MQINKMISFIKLVCGVKGIQSPKHPQVLILPENNVLSIESVIHKNGTNYQTLPTQSEFSSDINKWYEMPSLAENSIFVDPKFKTSIFSFGI